MNDAIDTAIRSAAEPESIRMDTLQARLPTGRPCVIVVPSDITPMEALAFTTWVAGVLVERIAARAAAAPASRILVPHGLT